VATAWEEEEGNLKTDWLGSNAFAHSAGWGAWCLRLQLTTPVLYSFFTARRYFAAQE
jgi:hypothetical protein